MVNLKYFTLLCPNATDQTNEFRLWFYYPQVSKYLFFRTTFQMARGLIFIIKV